jgi:hypothetical protein
MSLRMLGITVFSTTGFYPFRTTADTSKMPNNGQEDERSVATGDDSSNAAGYIKNLQMVEVYNCKQ